MLSLFKRRRFFIEVSLLCVRWVRRYAHEIEKRVRQYQGISPVRGAGMRPMCASAVAGYISSTQPTNMGN
ncbi:hypothetical protein [Microvirga sp. TS319]|uniref:hypothetical protein n=1 Tax=Microvirga sp. TS319 TaxID=3241165 RepID=UPI00351A648C